MNKVILIGNLTKEPALYETQSGKTVCKLDIAVKREYLKDGEKEADFFNLSVWGMQAEHCHKYLSKGSKIAVCGRLLNTSYEDKDGNKRTKTEIVVENIEFLKFANKDENQGENREVKPALEPIAEDEELPF